MRISAIVVITLLICLGYSTSAFHDKGSASCNGCHIMHEEDGTALTPDGYLLRAESASDICLSCHANQYGRIFVDDPLNPPSVKGAGNFAFLLEDNLNDSPNGATNPISGDAAGHNINAPSKGVGADGTHITAPGGMFPSIELGCTSCHDPHGNTSFRMLNGVGPVQNGIFSFTYPAPNARGIPLGNQHQETNSNHTAYRSGMTDWCSNCHGFDYHESQASNFEHPSDERFESEILNSYNLYNGTHDPTGGSPATAYLAAVPFEETGSQTNRTSGATSNSYIMCLSCHRAHATSAPHAGRWDFYIVNLNTDGLVSGSYPIPNPYNNSYQEKLCQKCHSNDNEADEFPPVQQ